VIVKALFTLFCLPVTVLSLMAFLLGLAITGGSNPNGIEISWRYAVGFALLMPLVAHVFLIVALLVNCASYVRKFVGFALPVWLIPSFVVWGYMAGTMETVKLMVIAAAYLWAWIVLADPRRAWIQQSSDA